MAEKPTIGPFAGRMTKCELVSMGVPDKRCIIRIEMECLGGNVDKAVKTRFEKGAPLLIVEHVVEDDVMEEGE